MTRSRFALLQRSLIARMALLSILFVVLALGWFFLVPVGAHLQRDMLALTETLAQSAVHDALDALVEGRTGEQQHATTLARIATINPNFRYFGRQGDKEIKFGAAPKWQHVSPLNTAPPWQENNQTYWTATLAEKGARTHVSHRYAGGKATYVEVSGIENSVSWGLFDVVRPVTFWWASKRPLIVAGGVFLMGFLVLLLAARSLRALTRTVRSFQSGSGVHLLPEKGLPTEVAPLVHAVNEMIARLEHAREHQQLFLAAAAHELRTPMTVLRTRLEGISDGTVKEELRQDLRRMASLVDQLLQLMSIGSHRDLPDEVDLVTMAREVITDHAPLAMRQGVQVDFHTEVDALVVRGDRGLVKIALANLLDNAISFSKASDNLEVRVRVDASVTVRDNGPGIPATEVGRIFEPFAKTPPNRKGHGLGLAIANAIMGLHGGTVSVRTAEKKGATFALRFGVSAA